MLRALYQLIFGCRHRALSWPLTVAKPRKRTYVVCLSCGTEFDYDFEAMQLCQPTTMRTTSNIRPSYASEQSRSL
jgi:hypothetical protein